MRNEVEVNASCSKSFLFKVRNLFENRPLFLAFALNSFAFLYRIILFDIKYEVSDDYMTDAVLSGAFGSGYDPNLLFGNSLLGNMLVLLYKLIPKISFYFVLLVLLGFVSVTAILYIMFRKKINCLTVCLAAAFLCLYADDLYVLIQFTKVSTAAGIAGGLLILFGLFDEEKHKIRMVITGSLIVISGTLVRFSAIYIFAFFLVIAFTFYSVRYFSAKEGNIKPFIRRFTGFAIRFLVCVSVVAVVYIMEYIGGYLSNLDERQRYFNEFHGVRYRITDQSRPEYEDVEDAYVNIGLDKIDYAMIQSWNFIDRDVYTDDLLEDIIDIQTAYSNSLTHSVTYVFEEIIESKCLFVPAAYALLLIAAAAVITGKNKFFPVIVLIGTIGLICGFIYYGRIVYRVEWSVYFCAAATVLSAFSYNDDGYASKAKMHLLGKERSITNTVSVFVLLVILLISISRFAPYFVFMNMSDKDYLDSFDNIMLNTDEYVSEKVSFPTLDRKPHPELISYMENDAEHYYYVDFATGIQALYLNYKPWVRPEEGLFRDSYAYFGSVTMRNPGEIDALSSNGADPMSPYKSLINDNILLVDNWANYCKLVYIRRYYYPDADIEKIAELNGYQIWNIYVPGN